MSLLSKISTGRKGRAQKVVIYAPEGFGKSTLASQFPSPLFLDIEDSTSQLDVSRLGRSELHDLKAFESAVAEIVKAKPCATVVIDTIDWLEQMALDAIIADADNAKIKGIEDFGFGKGYTILKERVTILLAKLDLIVHAGMTVVLLAHSKVNKFEPPDGAGPFDRYELKLSKQVAPLVKEWADMLLFGNWRVQVKEKDRNEPGAQFKGVGGKERLMYCNRTAAWDAKNRHSMADTEKWEISVIEKAFRAVGAPWGEQVSKPQTEPAKEEKTNEVSNPVSQIAQQPGSVTPPVANAGDEIPMQHATNGQPVDEELARICKPHSEAITHWMRSNGKIRPNETWEDAPADLANRIKKIPANFYKHIGIKGSEVLA